MRLFNRGRKAACGLLDGVTFPLGYSNFIQARLDSAQNAVREMSWNLSLLKRIVSVMVLVLHREAV
jgi:hypothetical protein